MKEGTKTCWGVVFRIIHEKALDAKIEVGTATIHHPSGKVPADLHVAPDDWICD
jgi:hypothetical protein